MSAVDAVALLQGLVERPSPTGSVDAARAYLVDQLDALGAAPTVDAAGNVRATFGAGPTRVLLCGHLDTVPGGPAPRLEDGVLWGRGAVDAKGALAAFVAAAHRHRQSDQLCIDVVAVPDEEGASHGARHLAATATADYLIIGEPSGARGVTLGYRGNVRLTYHARGEREHAGTPNPTPADRAHAWWQGVREWCAPHRGAGLFDTASPVLLSLHTDGDGDALRAGLTASVRTPPGFPTDDFLAFLKESAGNGEVRVEGVEAPHLGGRRNALVRAFNASIRNRGHRPRHVRKTGTSDLNVLAPALGAPAVAYGPGDSSLDHTPHERLPLSELLEAVEVLDGALARLAYGAGERGR